jgi:DNA-binding GntR family transcriptional regulator
LGIAPEREGPKVQVLAAELRDYVNTLSPGDPIGRVSDLVKRFADPVSGEEAKRTTLRDAIDLLMGEGLLSGGRGQSLRVRRQPTRLVWDLEFEKRSAEKDDRVRDGDWWDRMVLRQGRRPSQEVRLEFLETPPPDVAELLQWDGKTVVRHRVRRVDGTAGMLAVSYFAYPVVAGTPLAEPGDHNAPGGLLAAHGHPQAYLDWFTDSRMPHADEARHFGLARGVPVFEVTCVGYEETAEHPDGTPVRVMITVAPADRWRLKVRTDVS